MNKEVKEICMKCELEFHKIGKGCAFRSLGNEYCDLIEDFNKSITNYQNQVEKLNQENEHLKNIINAYENPNDVTKMFMYTDEITQDTINKLNELRGKNE